MSTYFQLIQRAAYPRAHRVKIRTPAGNKGRFTRSRAGPSERRAGNRPEVLILLHISVVLGAIHKVTRPHVFAGQTQRLETFVFVSRASERETLRAFSLIPVIILGCV